MRINKIWSACLAPLMVLNVGLDLAGPLAAFAQNGQPTQGEQDPKKPKKFKRDPKEFQVQDTKTPPDLPNLPAFPTGGRAVYNTGQVAANTKSGQIYTLSYSAKDDGRVVLEWYETAFRQYGWKALKTGNLINADKSGNRCQVFLLKSTKKGYRTDFVVLYTIPQNKPE